MNRHFTTSNLPVAFSVLSALVASGAAHQASAQGDPQRPNVILLVADDLGYGDLECYGATNVQTPNVNALANSGIRFTNAHATAATSTPSRYSLLTGEYAWRRSGTGVAQGNAGSIITPDRYTMADMFHDAGYATGAFGKWHLGLGSVTGQQDWNGVIDVTPRHLGFDYHYIQAATADRVPCVYLEQDTVANYDPSAPIYVDYSANFPGEPSGANNPELLKLQSSHGHNNAIVDGIGRIGFMKGGGKALWKDENIADSIAAHSARFIAEHKNEPFFMYLCTNDVHVPRWPHERFRGKNIMGLRGDAIASFDWTVGEIMKALEENGLTDNTLIILTSDNGPMLDDGYADEAIERLNGHRASGKLRGYKYSGYEGGTRVPFIVSWPKGVEAATSPNPTLISHIDLFASLGQMVGVELPDGAALDSGDQLDQILGKSTEHRPWVVEQNTTNAVSVRTDQWKYIPANNGVHNVSWINYQDTQYVEIANQNYDQLFDLIADPEETTNVATQNPEVLQMMKEIHAEAMKAPAMPFTPPTASTETETHWYNLYTPLRDNLCLTQASTSFMKGDNAGVSRMSKSQWKFVELPDGTFHIINRANGSYINPASATTSSELKFSTTAPAKGWKCDYAITPGYVVFYTADGSAQLNMGNASRSYMLLNWGSGRHDDDGCQFLLKEVNDSSTPEVALPTEACTPKASTEEEPIWYTICAEKQDNTYLTEVESSIQGMNSDFYYPDQAWRLAARPDGKLDIISKEDGHYLAPVTATGASNLTMSENSPAAGWDIKSAVTEGLKIIVSGNVQAAVAGKAQDYACVNYGGGMDIGSNEVQFRFSDLTQALKEATTAVAEVSAPAAETTVWYDLYGRRVANPSHGIFINSNGKKVIL